MNNYDQPNLGPVSSFSLKLDTLNQALSYNSSVGPVTATGMASIISLASQVTGLPYEFFETVLELEVSYPEKPSYASNTPRGGDSHKPLPDPRYPHPSAWSARKGGPYYGLANVNKNAQIYIGITQISHGFWDDVRKDFITAGVNRSYLPITWWKAPLLIQLIAPLVYFVRYKHYYGKGATVTPSTVYMLHQQGPGWVDRGMPELAGRQSVKTAAVLRSARRHGGYF